MDDVKFMLASSSEDLIGTNLAVRDVVVQSSVSYRLMKLGRVGIMTK